MDESELSSLKWDVEELRQQVEELNKTIYVLMSAIDAHNSIITVLTH